MVLAHCVGRTYFCGYRLVLESRSAMRCCHSFLTSLKVSLAALHVLVLSPFVSLMVDQVRSLRKRGVSAAILSGNKGIEECLVATNKGIDDEKLWSLLLMD